MSTTAVVSKDQLVHIGPAVVYSVLAGGTSNPGTATIYDGENENGRKAIFVEYAQNTSGLWQSPVGTKFLNGIYVDVDATTTTVTVEYEPLPF